MKWILKTQAFDRWMEKAPLTDDALCKAVTEMEQGLIDADLGGGVVKKRIALPGRGKSGGTRTIVATNKGDRWSFLYGFAKKDRENITANELDEFRITAQELLSFPESVIRKMIENKDLLEVYHEPDN